jgi:MFS family permease
VVLAGRPRFSLAFEAPGYRWLWLNALCTSMTYTIELISQGWLILILTQSPLWVGLAAGLRGTSQAVFSFAGGTLADHTDRRTALIAMQAVQAGAALVVAGLVLAHAIQLWHVLLYVIVVGCAFAISKPMINGLIYDVVGARRLLNANAFQLMAGSILRILGALLGGLVIARLGVGQNYLLICAAYAVGIAGLLALRSPAPVRRDAEPFVAAVGQGFQYALRTPAVRGLLWLSLAIESFGFSYQYMLPVMARDVLKVGALGLGYLTAMGGVGQFLATVQVAAGGDVPRKGTLMIAAAIGFGVCLVLFSLSPWFLVSLGLIAIVGYLGSLYDATMSTVLQVSASEEMHGRVMGLYYATWGLNQLGALGIGAVASVLGMPVALAIAGAIVPACALGLVPNLRVFNARPVE